MLGPMWGQFHSSVPNETITDALKPYGKVLSVKMDAYKGVYIGVRNVLIEITTPIPSSMCIAEHWCNAFYPAQTPTCFACRKTGHTQANCPEAQPIPIPVVEAAEAEDLPRQQDAPGVSNEVPQILGSSVKGTTSLPTLIVSAMYASATRTAPSTKIAPVVPKDPVSVPKQAMDEEHEIEVDLSDFDDSDASDEGDQSSKLALLTQLPTMMLLVVTSLWQLPLINLLLRTVISPR